MTSMELRGVRIDGPDGDPVLDGLDLVVPDGTTMALCGPAGSGKSAALRVLMGLDDPVAGQVLLDDDDVTRATPRERDLAFVMQDHPLHPSLDVHDNLAFASRLRRGVDRSALAERIDDVAAFLALDTLLDARPGDLEPAQRQRVAIGRVLVRDARGYLFDEAFSAQADRVRTHVRSVTLQWQREEGRTSLFTTSRPDEALTMAEQIAVMHRGAVHQVGSPSDLYASPDDLFVAAFLGQPQMNLLPAVVEGTTLRTPVATFDVGEHAARSLAGRESVIVGIRPEHCVDASVAVVDDDAVVVEGTVDDVEWRGGTELVYLGYDLDEDVELMLEQIEDHLDYDLFQNFFVAELASLPRHTPDQVVRLVVPRQLVLLFDVDTGQRLPTL